MAVNKIVYGNDTLVDLTSDTISASDLAKGKTAHDKSGNSITGTFTLDSEIQDQDTVISQIQEALAGKTAMPNTSDANAAPSDIRNGKSAYVNGTKITGSVLDIVQGTPSISVSSTGLITAKATQSAGFVSDGTKSSTKQLTVQEAQTITPSLSEQIIASGRYLTGTQTISAITKELLASLDSDFIADNIAEGVDLFGLVGTLAGGGAQIATGTFTLTGEESTTINYTVTHGLGVVPNFAFCVTNMNINNKISEYGICLLAGVNNKIYSLWRGTSSRWTFYGISDALTNTSPVQNDRIGEATDTTIRFGNIVSNGGASSYGYFVPGTEYYWMVGVV